MTQVIWLLLWLSNPLPGSVSMVEMVGTYPTQMLCEAQLENALTRPPADRRIDTGRYACIEARVKGEPQ